MNKQEMYQMVIEAEIRAQMLYWSLSRAFQNPETSATFKQLVELEVMHEEYMRKLFAKEFDGLEPVVRQQKEVELKGVKLTDPLEVLRFAQTREDLARDAYLEIADYTEDPELKGVMNKFAIQEEDHKQLIQAEIDRLQGTMIWFDPAELSGLMED